MKLDVDISDRGQLLKAKAELARLLSVVEFALSQFGQPRNGDIQRTLFVSSNGHSEVREKDKPILEVIDSLSKKFTTSDVIIALGEKGKESRSAVKAAIRRSIESGFIKLIEAGEGRRPSKYEKVSLANRELANLWQQGKARRTRADCVARKHKNDWPAGDNVVMDNQRASRHIVLCNAGVAKRNTQPIWDRPPYQDCGFESRHRQAKEHKLESYPSSFLEG